MKKYLISFYFIISSMFAISQTAPTLNRFPTESTEQGQWLAYVYNEVATPPADSAQTLTSFPSQHTEAGQWLAYVYNALIGGGSGADKVDSIWISGDSICYRIASTSYCTLISSIYLPSKYIPFGSPSNTLTSNKNLQYSATDSSLWLGVDTPNTRIKLVGKTSPLTSEFSVRIPAPGSSFYNPFYSNAVYSAINSPSGMFLNVEETGLSVGSGATLNLDLSGGSSTGYVLTDIDGTGEARWQILLGGSTVGQLVGTARDDDASAGNIGEYVKSMVAAGSALPCTTNTALDVTSISLGKGDWDVTGSVNFNELIASVTKRTAGLSSTSATLPTDGTEAFCGTITNLASELNSVTPAVKRFSLSSPTTIYLTASATFSGGSVSAFGNISARRVR